jgi:hypothetical protein
MIAGSVATENRMNKTSETYTMALYYLPCLVRSDRYFITRLEPGKRTAADFNFVINADDRVLVPILTLEDPGKIVLNQMAPSDRQDIPLGECSISLQKYEEGFELLIRPDTGFSVEDKIKEPSGLRLDHSAAQKRITVGYYSYSVEQTHIPLRITLQFSETESYSTTLLFNIVRPDNFHRVVIDFGSEASQLGYKNGGPQSTVVPYDILENVRGVLNSSNEGEIEREDLLNHEPGQPYLYRSFYAVKRRMNTDQRTNFPFNFTDDINDDEIRLFITRKEVSATEHFFRDEYEIIPNLKLGIEKSLRLLVGDKPEDYSIRSHKQELISAILLRLLRLMISTKPSFRQGGIIVTLLVPNIYTQHDVFGLLNQLRERTEDLLTSLQIKTPALSIEYETISESDASFMGYQQTHPEEVELSNGEIALVIDCGKGTTDISMLLADDNENYSSFFRTGFAGAGNVLLYGFAEDFLTLVLKAVPGTNTISVKDFIQQQLLSQNLTADVLNFVELMEEQKKRFSKLQAIGIIEFAQVSENSISTERTIANLHRDPSTLLQYADSILRNRAIRWDEEVTGLVNKAVDCIVAGIISSIRAVITKDIRKRIKLVMLSGRAFYFDLLRTRLENELGMLLKDDIRIRSIPAGRALNNKNIALYGAFSGAYKITDFTGMPIDRKEGLSRNNDVLNNNMFLYRGIKIEPCNDILYNSAVVRRNNQELKAFKNKTIDICFTRDNIYLRLMENQRVRDVRSLYHVLTPVTENFMPATDLRAMSMFPNYSGELASLDTVFQDIKSISVIGSPKALKKRKRSILQFFQF